MEELLPLCVLHDPAGLVVRLDRQPLLVPADRFGLLLKGDDAGKRADVGAELVGRLVVLIRRHRRTIAGPRYSARGGDQTYGVVVVTATNQALEDRTAVVGGVDLDVAAAALGGQLRAMSDESAVDAAAAPVRQRQRPRASRTPYPTEIAPSRRRP